MMSPTELLRSVLTARLDPVPRAWLDSAVAAAVAGQSILDACIKAPKYLGRAALRLDESERDEATAAWPGVVCDRWTVVDAARTLLLLTLAEAATDDVFAEAATAWYEQGDSGEQQSWLKALPLLPRPERFLPLAIDACRTNIVPLFESIACDNPYPERHFPTPQFNQVVLKAVFVGLPLTRVVGLSRRRNDELSRMASDFADERRAAGRPVPSDLHLALFNPSPAESR